MRYVVLLLVVGVGACSDPLGLNALNVGPHSELTNVKVSPTVVRAGDRFVASASVTLHGDCTDPNVTVYYATVSVYSAGTTVAQSFTAIQGDTLLEFSSNCTPNSLFGGSSPRDDKWVTIHVLPAP